MDRKEILRAVKFTFFSLSAGIIEFGSFALLFNLIGLGYTISYLIALVLSVLWNFTLNRKFTFQSANNVPKAMMLVFLYYCVFTPVTTVLGTWLTDQLKWNGDLVTILNMVLNLATEYLYDRFVVFRDSLDTKPVKKDN